MTSHDCPLVLIEWQDSAQPTSSWRFLQSFQPEPAVRCVSVGWLIHDGEVKALAQNFGNLDDESSAQVSGVIHIPARCITQITMLDEPDTVSVLCAAP